MRREIALTFGWIVIATAAFPATHGKAQVIDLNVRTGCGGTPATGNGVTDDSPAFSACITSALALSAQGHPTVIKVPSGIYLIKSVQLPVMSGWGIKISGEGSHKSYVQVDPAYQGDVFAWSETSFGTSFDGTGFNPALDHAGASVEGISVSGDLSSPNAQNAFVFYDRDDGVYFRDVSVLKINGACLKAGYAKYQSVAYMTESQFYQLNCSDTGTSTQAAVDISSLAASNSDGSDQIKFFGLDVFGSAGIGLLIHNAGALSATRGIEFHSGRVEYSGADNIDIGAIGDLGQTHSVRFYSLTSVTPGATTDGFSGLNIGIGSVQDYDIEVFGGEIGPCWTNVTCKGIVVDNTRLTSIVIGNISTTGTNVTYTARTGVNVRLDAHGLESSFTYSAPGTVTAPAWNTFTP